MNIQPIFRRVAITVSLTACGPDYPDDETHTDATNADCVDCHVYQTDTDEDPREVPDSHTEGGDVKSRYEGCKKCHDKAE